MRWICLLCCLSAFAFAAAAMAAPPKDAVKTGRGEVKSPRGRICLIVGNLGCGVLNLAD